MDEPLAIAECAPPLAGVKRCFKCEQSKPYSEFYVKSKKTGLLHHMCKRCCIEREQARIKSGIAWQCKPENKEKKKAAFRKKYHEQPEKFRAIGLSTYYKRKPAALAQKKKWYYENQDREIARSSKWNRENNEKVQAWKEANRHRINASVRKHRLNHPESAKISRDARRARKKGAKCVRIKRGYEDRLRAWQKDKCPYCRVDLSTIIRHDDHVIPLAKGGEHSERNLQITCEPCNLRKHAKHPLDFAAKMGIVTNPIYIPI